MCGHTGPISKGRHKFTVTQLNTNTSWAWVSPSFEASVTKGPTYVNVKYVQIMPWMIQCFWFVRNDK